MDDQPRTDILKTYRQPGALIGGLLLLIGCPTPDAAIPPDLPAVGGQVSVIRLPYGGGVLEAFNPDSLSDPIWTSKTALPTIRYVVGINAEARLLWAVDAAKNLFAVDLESRGLRQFATGVESAAMIPNGTVYVLGAGRRIARYQGGLPTQYKTVLPVAPVFQTGTLGDRYLAVLGTKPHRLVVLTPERQVHATDIADGEAVATYWGDLVAVTSAAGVTLYQTDDPFTTRSVTTKAKARHLVFSPSAHRLYVAHDDRSIDVIDRYSLDRIASIDLPGQPAEIRTDGSGRWLLGRPTTGDSVWVVDLATHRWVGTVAASWANDLPTVAGAATFLGRHQGDVVALSLAGPIREIGRIPGGAADRWAVTTWLPKDRQALAAAAEESALVAQDGLLVIADSGTTAEDRVFLQVSSSQSASWSRDFAKQLSDAGVPAKVIDPTTPDEGYRVIVGPYGTREAAEETGRKLGRPYFILTNPPIRQ